MLNTEILLRAFPDHADPEEPSSTFGRIGDVYSALDDTRCRQIVDSSNFYEIPYLFSPPLPITEEAEERAYDDVAQALMEAWSSRLAQLHPDRAFTVTVDEPSDGLALRVTVRQEVGRPTIHRPA